MGTIKQDIVSGLSIKVGAVIGSCWRGISYMRGIAQNIRNLRTAGQLEQCSKFALVLDFLKPITAYIHLGYRFCADKQSAFNAAMSYIVRNCIIGTFPNYTLDYSSILVSQGSLEQVEYVVLVMGSCKANITWNDNTGQGSAKPSDVALSLVFNSIKNEAIFTTSGVTRQDEETEFLFPTAWVGDTVEFYLGFISADGSSVSNSLYLGSEVVTQPAELQY